MNGESPFFKLTSFCKKHFSRFSHFSRKQNPISQQRRRKKVNGKREKMERSIKERSHRKKKKHETQTSLKLPICKNIYFLPSEAIVAKKKKTSHSSSPSPRLLPLNHVEWYNHQVVMKIRSPADAVKSKLNMTLKEKSLLWVTDPRLK